MFACEQDVSYCFYFIYQKNPSPKVVVFRLNLTEFVRQSPPIWRIGYFEDVINPCIRVGISHFRATRFGLFLMENTGMRQMSRIFRTIGLLVFVASCGSGNFSAPRNLDSACSIVSQRPTYLRAMNAAENKWGVPVKVQMATIYQESKFIGNARTPHQYALGVIPMGRQSSAYGYSQALDATWDEYRRDTGRRGARRDDIKAATDFIGWYMAESSERLGISLDDTQSQYLAYHEGRAGFARGSYRSKSWLRRIAGEVDARAVLYGQQLQACGKA